MLGSLQDLDAIGKIVAQSDALLVLDTAQTAGVVPIDMIVSTSMPISTGHKGLLGPMGIGGMIVGEHVNVRPARVGGTGVDSITPFQPDNYPYHLEAGTVSIPGIAGLNAAQKWFAGLGEQHGADASASHQDKCIKALEHIHKHELAHARTLIDAMDAMDNVTVYGPHGNRGRVSTLSFNITNMPADQVGVMLDADHAVCTRWASLCTSRA